MDGRVVHTWPVGTNPSCSTTGRARRIEGRSPRVPRVSTRWTGTAGRSGSTSRSARATRPITTGCACSTRSRTTDHALHRQQDRSATSRRSPPAPIRRRPPTTTAQMDALVEVDMRATSCGSGGSSITSCRTSTPSKPNYVGPGKTVADHPGRINLNLPGKPLRRDWLHCNSVDYNAASGHIVINSVQGELYVIDHDGTFVAGDRRPESKGGRAGRRFPVPVRRSRALRAGRPAAHPGELGLGDVGPQADGRVARRALDAGRACRGRATSWSSTTGSTFFSARRSRRYWKSIRSSRRTGARHGPTSTLRSPDIAGDIRQGHAQSAEAHLEPGRLERTAP